MSCLIVPAITSDWCADNGGNEGGIKSIHIIAEDDHGDLPAVTVDTWTIGTDIPLVDATNAGWVSWDVQEDTASHQEAIQDSGRAQHTLTFTLPKDTATKRYVLATMTGGCCKFSIGYTDNNGMTKVIPGMKVRYEFNSGLGGDNDDASEFIVTASKIGKPAYHYTGAFLAQTP